MGELLWDFEGIGKDFGRLLGGLLGHLAYVGFLRARYNSSVKYMWLLCSVWINIEFFGFGVMFYYFLLFPWRIIFENISEDVCIVRKDGLNNIFTDVLQYTDTDVLNVGNPSDEDDIVKIPSRMFFSRTFCKILRRMFWIILTDVFGYIPSRMFFCFPWRMFNDFWWGCYADHPYGHYT